MKAKSPRPNRKQFVCSLLCLFIVTLCFGLTVGRAQEGIRADLPENGNLRVENLRGSVTVEVWNENHVSISATTNGQLSRTAAIIERTERLLSVRVAPGPATTESGVSLAVRIPARAHAAIFTSTGTVRIIDLPAALLVQTKSGPIYAEFPPDANASVIAQSVQGTVSSELPRTPRPSERSPLQARLGTGRNSVRLHTETGMITLAPTRARTASLAPLSKTSRPAPDDITETDPPRLIGGNSRTTSGNTTPTPAATPEEISEGDVIRVDTQLASVNFSVIDRGSNRGIVGLRQMDFRLFEDGVEQKIAQFETSAEPFNLVLLIDLSGSTSEVIEMIKTAALHFVRATRPFDRISVITFAGNQEVVSPLTTDRAALRDRINAMRQPKGSTKLYDSIAFAMEHGFKGFKGSGRNAIVLLSDGLDSTMPKVMGEGSTLPFNDVLRAAQEFDGIIYSLWLNTQIWEPTNPNEIQNATYDLAGDQLENLAEAGGGVFYEVLKVEDQELKLEDLTEAYERVVTDLGTLYTLSYRPSNKLHDGKWRAVSVNVNRPNTVARGKRGYYAR